MASWTDPSRQYLITSIRNRPVIWDKSYFSDNNYKSLKRDAFMQVSAALNAKFPSNFNWEDVRSQWKNLKDTFVRKLRWVHEGKYLEDQMKEPTWKFYRQLTFLNEKEAKRLDACEHTYELEPAPSDSRVQRKKRGHYEAGSSQDQMLSLFNASPDDDDHEKLESSGIMMTPPRGVKRRMSMRYSPTNSNNGSSSDGVEDEEEDDEDCEPGAKKPHRRQSPGNMMPPAATQSPIQQDEFDHFGAMVAATLRRISIEQNHPTALRVQRRLYDALFAEEQ
ncbi:unnamed protein product [Caenorhabditis brenneri]